MADELIAVAGKRIYIGGTAIATKSADFTESDFSAVSWTEIDGWETHGSYGDTAATITTSLINRKRDLKQKGTRNAGQMTNNFAILRDDAGQAALRAAVDVNDNYPFKIVDVDAPVSGTPSMAYFIGLVMSANEQGGSANTVQMLQSVIEVNSNVVYVDHS